jgi:hypothetical protein
VLIKLRKPNAALLDRRDVPGSGVASRRQFQSYQVSGCQQGPLTTL